MTSTIVMAAARTRRAFEGLCAAQAFDSALDHWGDFLTYWRRTLRRVDLKGRQTAGHAWRPVQERVSADPALFYLWEARNAEEHGLAPNGEKLESAIHLAEVGGPMILTELRETPEGYEYIYEPAEEGAHFELLFYPEHLRLVALRRGRRIVEVPKGFTYDIGDPPAPVALARLGLSFMEAELARVGELPVSEQRE